MKAPRTPKYTGRCALCPSLAIEADRCCVDGCAVHVCPDHYHSAECEDCDRIVCDKHARYTEDGRMCPRCYAAEQAKQQQAV